METNAKKLRETCDKRHDELQRVVGALEDRVEQTEDDQHRMKFTLSKVGDTLVKLDKIEEAHWQYLMAFRGLQQCNLPKDNPHTSRILVSLGDVFFSAADYSRALKYYEKSIRFCVESNRSDVSYAGLMKCGLGKYWPEDHHILFLPILLHRTRPGPRDDL